MARKHVFNFEGTSRSKFLIAGANYIRKPLRLNRNAITLVSFVETNFSEVCDNGLTKGFCTGQCKTCPIQGARDQSLITLATRPQTVINYNISDCRNVIIYNEPCARDRGVILDK